MRQGSQDAGRPFHFSQVATQGHADEQFSTESCVRGSGPSFRTTVKNIWSLGQDSGMKKKICRRKIREHEVDF